MHRRFHCAMAFLSSPRALLRSVQILFGATVDDIYNVSASHRVFPFPSYFKALFPDRDVYTITRCITCVDW